MALDDNEQQVEPFEGELRAYWMVTEDGPAFYAGVADVEQAQFFLRTMARYDDCLHAQRLRSEPGGFGGLEVWMDGSWEIWFDQETDCDINELMQPDRREPRAPDAG